MATEKPFEGKFSTELAIASFGTGTLLFAAHRQFPDVAEIGIIGMYYLVFALFINGLVLLKLLYHFFRQPGHREYLAIKILILLSNIPIAVFYIYIATHSFTLFINP